MLDVGMCWCPECRRWVPEKKMHYDGLTRVCDWCLSGVSGPATLVQDVHHEQTACIYCGSYDTVEQVPKWRWFECGACGATFRL